MSANLPDQTQDLLLALTKALPRLDANELAAVKVHVTAHMRRAFEIGRASATPQKGQTDLFGAPPFRRDVG